jgi:fluoride ion exporter CrcB/FEX
VVVDSDGVDIGVEDDVPDDLARARAKSMLRGIRGLPKHFGKFYTDETVASANEEEEIEAEVQQAFQDQKCMEVTLHVGAVLLALVILGVSIGVMFHHDLVREADNYLDFEVFRYLAFAPFGSISRWLLFVAFSCFPVQWHLMHVVIANTLACGIDSLAQVLAYRDFLEDGADDFGYLWWSGIITGLAGCLSTVSTMIGELRKKELAKCCLREFYVITLFGLAALVLLLPLGLAQCSDEKLPSLDPR